MNKQTFEVDRADKELNYYMKKRNNKYIGTIIEGDCENKQKVIFKDNNDVYIKNIKEKNKIRTKKYALLENVNIICNDLNDDYVYIDSDNRPYMNKFLWGLLVSTAFVGIIITGITMVFFEKYFLLTALALLALSAIILIYVFYVVIFQHKKIYKRFTETTNGEVIDYCRTELRQDKNDVTHCKYNLMYKYKTPNGDTVHSVVISKEAQFIYQDYPLNKSVLVDYNPEKCCESCLADEYNGVDFGQRNSVNIRAFGIVTGITPKCIDEDVEDYLKKYYVVDYIECEYYASDKKYRLNSIFSVPHNRFKVGDEIRIFYETENPERFFCDINKMIR